MKAILKNLFNNHPISFIHWATHSDSVPIFMVIGKPFFYGQKDNSTSKDTLFACSRITEVRKYQEKKIYMVEKLKKNTERLHPLVIFM